jgi:hypothetical protein
MYAQNDSVWSICNLTVSSHLLPFSAVEHSNQDPG